VTAKLDETYNSIRSATYGIAFFGTPHQGGNGAKLGQIAATIASVCLRNPKNTFLEALKKDSLFADDLVKDFRHQLEDYHVLSFYETCQYKKLGLVSHYSRLYCIELTFPDCGCQVCHSWSSRNTREADSNRR
jgi:hypothetical protein